MFKYAIRSTKWHKISRTKKQDRFVEYTCREMEVFGNKCMNQIDNLQLRIIQKRNILSYESSLAEYVNNFDNIPEI